MTCRDCDRGREACEWCHNVTDQDWEAMCDCGLYDFGKHLIGCDRTEFRWVIAQDHASAEERRA